MKTHDSQTLNESEKHESVKLAFVVFFSYPFIQLCGEECDGLLGVTKHWKVKMIGFFVCSQHTIAMSFIHFFLFLSHSPVNRFWHFSILRQFCFCVDFLNLSRLFWSFEDKATDLN
jgi:hypothetical protein